MADVQWKVGDVVQLKSGGPAMTVESVSERTGSVGCVYFDKDQKRYGHTFAPDSLQKYEPPKARQTSYMDR